jgi:hypothetical protein
MRIAVCLSGQLRNYKETFPYFKNFIINELDPDIFIFTDEYDPKLIELYSPKKIDFTTKLIENNFSYRYRHTSTNDISLLNQFYKISECNKLKCKYEEENNFKYDLVIRCRFDAFFVRKFNKEELLLDNDEILVPWGWDFKCVSEYAETDIFAIGKSETIDKYSSVFDNLEKYKNDIIFHPESIMGYNLFMNNVRVKTYLINFQFSYPEIDENGNNIDVNKKIEELKNNQIFYNETLWENKIFYYPHKK